jgi:hypothetical protein
MPKATAVWLVENTSLTFEQVAEFCGLHPLEVKGIADGDVAQGIKGQDPVSSGQLTREEIQRAEKNPDHHLQMAASKVEIPVVKSKKGPRYTPLSRRQDRPNAILWLVKNHPEMKDSQIMRLVGTTKPTIESIRDRTHWNSANLVPQDPVALGLCTQIDLDAEVKKAAKRITQGKPAGEGGEEARGGTLLPAEETTRVDGEGELATAPSQHKIRAAEAEEARSVFARLEALKPAAEAATAEAPEADTEPDQAGEAKSAVEEE